MPYVIKHREKDLYVPGTASRKATRYDLYLVEKKWTKIYPTLPGARSALAAWADLISHKLKVSDGIGRSIDELKNQIEIVENELTV